MVGPEIEGGDEIAGFVSQLVARERRSYIRSHRPGRSFVLLAGMGRGRGWDSVAEDCFNDLVPIDGGFCATLVATRCHYHDRRGRDRE